MSVSEEPLVWTSKGNLPASSLEYRTGWIDRPEFTQFIEQYLLDGEVVKESSHVFNREGLTSEGIAQQM